MCSFFFLSPFLPSSVPFFKGTKNVYILVYFFVPVNLNLFLLDVMYKNTIIKKNIETAQDTSWDLFLSYDNLLGINQ